MIPYRPDWDEFYMRMAYHVSSRSRDRSTHAGCVIAAPDNTIRSIGYNDLPRNIENEGPIMEDGLPKRRSRIGGEKYKWTEHSERNAIYNAGRNGVPVVGCTLYVNWKPCSDCARAAIQSGISKVLFHKQGQDAFLHSIGEGTSNWASDHDTVIEMMEEAGIEVVMYDQPLPGTTCFFSGKVYEFGFDGVGYPLDEYMIPQTMIELKDELLAL